MKDKTQTNPQRTTLKPETHKEHPKPNIRKKPPTNTQTCSESNPTQPNKPPKPARKPEQPSQKNPQPKIHMKIKPKIQSKPEIQTKPVIQRKARTTGGRSALSNQTSA